MERVDGTLSRYIKSMKKNPSEILPEESTLHTDPSYSYRDVIELWSNVTELITVLKLYKQKRAPACGDTKNNLLNC